MTESSYTKYEQQTPPEKVCVIKHSSNCKLYFNGCFLSCLCLSNVKVSALFAPPRLIKFYSH